MQKAARRGDKCTGHGDARSRPAQRGSSDTWVNDKASLRKGDAFVKHGPDAHPGEVDEGSSTVWINDRPAARQGDAVDCGGSIEGGSNDVFIGD